MNDNLKLAFLVSVQLGDQSVLEQRIAANSVFGAVKFIQDEAAANGWFVVSLLVEPLTEANVQDAVEVKHHA